MCPGEGTGRPVVRHRAARARALIEAGRAAVYSAVGDARQFVQEGGRITGDNCISLGLAGTTGFARTTSFNPFAYRDTIDFDASQQCAGPINQWRTPMSDRTRRPR